MAAATASTCAAGSPDLCEKLVQSTEMIAKRFINDDACGDWVFPLGQSGLEFQAANAASAGCYMLAGACLFRSASTPIARGYGLMICAVGFGSFSFHATTSLSGFIIDIVPMAVTAAFMLFRGIHALQADAGQTGPEAETKRFAISAGCAFFAVYIPWAMMALGVSHPIVWGVWAFLFGSMGAAFGVVCLLVFFNEGILNGPAGRDLGVAIACVLLGLGCSLQSFMPGLCDGWRSLIPLHAVWHVFSSVTAHRCGRLLDTLTKVVIAVEDEARTCKKHGENLLLRLLKFDCLPSQFSM